MTEASASNTPKPTPTLMVNKQLWAQTLELIDALRAENAELCCELARESSLRAERDAAINYQNALRGEIHRLQSERDAAESRTAELAARVEALRQLAIGQGPQHLYQGDCPYDDDFEARDPDCPACQILSSTPAADLAARSAERDRDQREHDDRIRRETVGNCHWAQDDYGWRTQCGVFWIFNGDGTDGTPEENGALFCHHCGKHLVPVTNEDPEAGIAPHAGEKGEGG